MTVLRLALSTAIVLASGCGTAPPIYEPLSSDASARPRASGAATSARPAPAASTMPACPPHSAWNGAECYGTTVVCPLHAVRVDDQCIAEVTCPEGSTFHPPGCVADGPAMTAPPDACKLLINSIPAATVLVDGAVAGETPLMNFAVAPGLHTVTFVHATLGKRTVTTTCKANETKAVAVKLAT